ncbi:TetR/AcrR family transcriptional regulator [Nocardia sp. CA2R105]|uniref:TetR/AcrR family transcriptional regulator n=1 Tax=Nocardia coffeae TaxID=2873381 RepID=UPI001CA5F9B2|nr:TetR/AcrR family transcriptional regulator [Nocardia coffeae]MBY8862882.1 TetR/AcrR family transcriptional regulator [Nocardia coffeae]
MCAGDRYGHIDDRSSAHDAEAQKILHAARLVLERSAFRSLKIRQVLVASGSSASNFYRRFPSKAHLLLALLEDEVRLADQRLHDEIDAADPIAEQLLTWLRNTIGNVSDRARAQRTRLFLDPDLLEMLPEQLHSLHRIIDDRLGEIVRRGIRSGELRPGDPETDAMLVCQLVRGLVTNRLDSGIAWEEDDFVTHVHAFVLRALGGTA